MVILRRHLGHCAVELIMPSFYSALFQTHLSNLKQLQQISIRSNLGFSFSTSEPDQYHEVRFGANVRINALTSDKLYFR